MKYLMIALFFSMNCFAITAKEAQKISININKNKESKFNEWSYKACNRGVSYSVKEAAKAGESYIHLILPQTCRGDGIEKLKKHLISTGFQVHSVETGINGAHWNTVFTIAW